MIDADYFGQTGEVCPMDTAKPQVWLWWLSEIGFIE